MLFYGSVMQYMSIKQRFELVFGHEKAWERERGVIIGPNFIIFPNYKSLLSVGSHDSWIMAHKWNFIFLYVNILNISITFL